MPGLAIHLVVGLGNAGPEYEHTRHNAGFWLVDELAARYGGRFREEPHFDAQLARVRIAGSECWLAKSLDYMNTSGRVMGAVAGFYKLEPAMILVAHDELDLPVGELRLKLGGGAGGHNGLKSLIAHLGPEFWRLRIGIGHPGERERVNPWLLSRIGAGERAPLEKSIPAAADAVSLLFEEGAERVMQKLHTAAGAGSG
jgi:PTH1 family peptidyl-tRNA hydrolase